jgi:hypothetical protein
MILFLCVAEAVFLSIFFMIFLYVFSIGRQAKTREIQTIKADIKILTPWSYDEDKE